VLLTGCFTRQPVPAGPSPIVETSFQSYSATFQGVLHPSPDADYQLITDIGKIIYLTTSDDLTSYLKQKIEITGNVTGEQNSILEFQLDSVVKIQDISEGNSSSMSNAIEKDEEEDLKEDVDEELTESSSSSSLTTSSSSASLAEDFIVNPPKSKEEAIAMMSAENIDKSQWTFTYCTHHFEGFCVPIHKNWWYKAFGATSESLFHIEIAQQELLELGDGIINVDLVPEGEDERFDARFPRVSWANNKYVFVVSGPIELQEAIEYVANSITGS
jgi:hypothetical protein